MQDEINEKTVNLAVRVGKLTYDTLRKAIGKIITELEHGRQNTKAKLTQKTDNKPELKHGKQTLRQLQKHNDGLSSMELKDPNLRLLYSTMKKHDIDFSPVKDGKGKYILFFKGKDADVLTHAFKKYTQKTVKLANHKPPIQKTLTAAKATVKTLNDGRDKVKNKSIGEREL